MRDWEMSLCDILCSIICPRTRLGVTCTPKVRVLAAVQHSTCAAGLLGPIATIRSPSIKVKMPHCHSPVPPSLRASFSHHSHTALFHAHSGSEACSQSINHIHQLPRTNYCSIRLQRASCRSSILLCGCSREAANQPSQSDASAPAAVPASR
jgi:hypothetical protein